MIGWASGQTRTFSSAAGSEEPSIEFRTPAIAI